MAVMLPQPSERFQMSTAECISVTGRCELTWVAAYLLCTRSLLPLAQGQVRAENALMSRKGSCDRSVQSGNASTSPACTDLPHVTVWQGMHFTAQDVMRYRLGAPQLAVHCRCVCMHELRMDCQLC